MSKKEMPLGDLEFKAEDVSIVIDRFGDREFITSSYGNHEILCEAIVNEVNKLLRERLEKAPKLHATLVYSVRTKAGIPNGWTQSTNPLDSHTARLVCIEKIKT